MFTMQEIEPLAVCLVTQQMFDNKFRSNFADNLILRDRDIELEPRLLKMKREMNSGMTENRYLQGHKMNIVNNIDRIISLSTRFASQNLKSVENIVDSGKTLIEKVLNADNFEDIARMEPAFKSQITLPIYSLFVEKSKA